MKISTPDFIKKLLVALLLFASSQLNAQLPFWSNSGNNASTGDFLGTNNNQPLIMKSNSLEGLRIMPNGTVLVSSFLNLGNGLVTSTGGVLGFKAFPNDTNQVFTGSGSFKSISALSGWTRSGNVLYNANGVNVGIGLTNPVYPLEVQGSAFFHGTVYADGIVLANKMLVDTLKTGVMFTLNNNLSMRGGSLNEVYTSSGDLRIQSNSSYSGNTIFNAGTNGNVGIGTFTPQYKLDVTGPSRFANDVYLSRIRPLPGDTAIYLGDSSIVFGASNRMFPTLNSTVHGIAIGNYTSTAYGTYSLALGSKVQTSSAATRAIVIGCGVIAGTSNLENTISNSLMIGFNSDKPTLFISPANGLGTIGKVGIGNSNPQSMFQVGSDYRSINVGAADAMPNFSGTFYIGFNAARNSQNTWVTRTDFAHNGGVVFLGDISGGLHIAVLPSDEPGGLDKSWTDQEIVDHTVFQINQSGRVIIGPRTQVGGTYDNPNTLLTVDGGIVCSQLHVTMNSWADSIFVSGFHLMSIDSLDNYIKSNGHLPGVPSQKEVQQDGVDLAQNDVVLLAKIEELTLYMLELENRIEQLEKENAELKQSEH